MKKYIIPLLTLSMTLIGCSAANNSDEATDFDRSSLSILSPIGAPALAFYNYSNLDSFETNKDPQFIAKAMIAGQKDIIVLPTNAGIQPVKSGKADYKLAATITFGNFYIATLKNDDNGIMDASDNILLFQQGGVPDSVFHYIYGDVLNDGISYCNNAAEAAAALTSGTYATSEGDNITPNYVLVAEPNLTTALDSKGDAIGLYANLQEKYKEKSNNLELFQASVFIKNSVTKDQGEAFLSSLKKDVEDALNSPEKIEEGMNKSDSAQTKYGVPASIAKRITKDKNNGLGLGFKLARDNKEAITTFLGILGISGIDEEVYF